MNDEMSYSRCIEAANLKYEGKKLQADRGRGRAQRSSSVMTRKGQCQSVEHQSCFKGNVRETSERQGGAHN